MSIVKLPAFIREATLLSIAEKEQLSAVPQLPDEEAVDQIRGLPEVRDLLQAFIGDESTRNTHIQLKAKEYLQQGDVEMAWKLLLL